jgi:hypothetical protein
MAVAMARASGEPPRSWRIISPPRTTPTTTLGAAASGKFATVIVRDSATSRAG